MKNHRRQVIRVAAVLLLSMPLAACNSRQIPASRIDPPAQADDPAALLTAQMQAGWAAPIRRTWRIEYKPIDGLENTAAWHVAGTRFWARTYPSAFGVDVLDKNATYEIDAAAIDQNYGTIEFYVYRSPTRVDQ